MACNGKCYLAKQIRIQEERENKLPISILKNMEQIILFCSVLSNIELRSIIFEQTLIIGFPYQLKIYYSALNAIFQPPR